MFDRQGVTVALSTALITTAGDSCQVRIRCQQYLSGLQRVLAFFEDRPGTELFWVDNTLALENCRREFQSLASSAFDRENLIFFEENELGVLNKGCGVLSQWARLLQELSGSCQTILFFEPRLQVESWHFFENVLSNPHKSRFRVNRFATFKYGLFPKFYQQFETGLLAIERSSMEAFVRTLSPEDMYRAKLSIEDALFSFFARSGLRFEAEPTLGVRRFAPEGEYAL